MNLPPSPTNWPELNWVKLNWTELNWTELSWTERTQTELHSLELKLKPIWKVINRSDAPTPQLNSKNAAGACDYGSVRLWDRLEPKMIMWDCGADLSQND